MVQVNHKNDETRHRPDQTAVRGIKAVSFESALSGRRMSIMHTRVQDWKPERETYPDTEL